MDFNLSCPIPIKEYPIITMAHGSGGVLSHNLIEKMFRYAFENDLLDEGHDGAVFEVHNGKMAYTTDSFVVNPLFFPGGNIGDLAVNGTINDLVCCGAKPLYLSAGFILEEGLPMEDLWRIVLSMKEAADRGGVKIITGDTKVVDRGKGDKIFINTSGVGIIPEGINISPKKCRPGDAIILSGRIGDHGVAIMSARSGLEFETKITSDTVALNGLADIIFNTTQNIHVLRDPTRGGLATTLNELARSADVGMLIDEGKIPVSEEVKGACEILGLDPLYIANEGKLIIILPEEEASRVVGAMKHHQAGAEASVIGRVISEHPGLVRMTTSIGSSRIVDMLTGDQLPRIC
jgi:hydrogenase expression/formation protein HypE